MIVFESRMDMEAFAVEEGDRGWDVELYLEDNGFPHIKLFWFDREAIKGIQEGKRYEVSITITEQGEA